MNRLAFKGLAAALLLTPALGASQSSDITLAQFLRGERIPLKLEVDSLDNNFMAVTITVPGEGGGLASVFTSPLMMMGMFGSGG